MLCLESTKLIIANYETNIYMTLLHLSAELLKYFTIESKAIFKDVVVRFLRAKRFALSVSFRFV